MRMFSKLFSRSTTKKLTPSKLLIINSENKIISKNANKENSIKSMSQNFIQFFRTSRIVDAYQDTNNSKIDRLLSKGKSYYKSVKFPENNNFSLMHQAITDRNTQIIELILTKKYSTDEDVIHDNENDLGLAPLHLACIYNYEEILDILLKKGKSRLDVLSSTDELTALHVSASAGSLKCLAYLSENYYLQNQRKNILNESKAAENDESIKDDIETTNKSDSKDKVTNIEFKEESTEKRTSNSTKKLRSNLSSKHITNGSNSSQNYFQDNNHEHKENKYLNRYSSYDQTASPLDIFNAEKWTPLHYACFHNKMDSVSYLIENGSDLLLQNEQKLSPLALCVLADNLDLFNALYNYHFKNPENRDFTTEDEFSIEVSEQAQLVHIASISKKGTKCLDYLLGDANNVNMICSKELNSTPLHFACMKSNLKAVKSLLKYNANVNVADYLGNTPLFYATENGNIEILKLLHEYGADGIRKNNNGVNCFQIAMNQDNRDVKHFYLGQNQYRHMSEKDQIF